MDMYTSTLLAMIVSLIGMWFVAFLHESDDDSED